MSYTFSVTAATKGDAKSAIAAEFEKVVSAQPQHVNDQATVLASVSAVIDSLADDATQDIYVACNQFVNEQGNGGGFSSTAVLMQRVAVVTQPEVTQTPAAS